ncbi:PREDICTED: probable F-box protein At4g22165 [Camelina sativa]|uniref:Probable F-box protein At4g22165 n=1 Tax=Camelina sativa TaxID=90675 RepID=A0ABM0VLR4_CAMSA|nr:PREDICTED: probable F-box protein At4g22165 [Camelina sativa]
MLKLKKTSNSKRRREEAKLSSMTLDELLSYDHERREKKARKRRNCLYWSELPPDLIHSVLQRLSLRDLQRAKSICSAWLSASRSCLPKSQDPWLIIFPNNNEDDMNMNRCKLFNPEEKDKLYSISQDLGVGGVCVATYGCWLLMRNPLFNLYMVNLLTGQRIDLPPVESQRGKTKLERIVDDKFHATQLTGSSQYYEADSIGLEINSPGLWIDEEARDYLVIFSFKIPTWPFDTQCAVICKKGDHSWREFPDGSPCSDMVYKHHKLYVYRYGAIQIFDFSGDSLIPLKAPETDAVYVAPFSFDDFRHESCLGLCDFEKTSIVVTVSGHVLMVVSVVTLFETWSFRIYKMCSCTKKWERLLYLDGEAILLDLGVTVPAIDFEGINDNSIYFSGLGINDSSIYFSGLGQDDKEDDIFIFNLKEETIKRPHQSVSSSLLYSCARWFLPGFSYKY